MNEPTATTHFDSRNLLPRKPYVTPALIELGELRDITLGASPGIGDSGGTQPQRCPGCP